MITKDYIAGFIDGEGYLGIMRMTNPKPRFVVAIKIAQIIDKDSILYEIQKMYGGRLEYRNHKGNQRKSTTLCFLNNIEIERVLLDLKDLLIVKKEQCDVLLEFVNLPKGKTGHNFTKDKALLEEKLSFNRELFNKKEQLYLKIRELNKVGK